MRLAKLDGLAGPVFVHPDAVLSIVPARKDPNGGPTSWVTVRTVGETGQPLVVRGSPETIFALLERADREE